MLNCVITHKHTLSSFLLQRTQSNPQNLLEFSLNNTFEKVTDIMHTQRSYNCVIYDYYYYAFAV